MSITKLNPVFAEDGGFDSEATFETWAGNGWVDERVRYKGLNKAIQRVDKKINETIDRAPKVMADAGTLEDSIRGLYTPQNSFSFCAASPLNITEVTAAVYPHHKVAACVIDGEHKILVMGGDVGTIIVIDAATMTVEETVTGLDSALPVSGGSERWRPVRAVCDAGYAYVLFYDGGVASGYYLQTRVLAFDLATWASKTGWPSEGTIVGACRTALTGNDEGVLIFATTSLLAYCDPDTLCSLSSDAGVKLIDIDTGSVEYSGCGDLGSASAGVILDITSDGTNIYGVAKDSTDETNYVFAATIADLSIGLGGAYPKTAPENWHSRIAYGGGYLCTVTIDTNSLAASVGTVENPNHLTLLVSPADDTVLDDPGFYALTYDGLNFWALGLRYSTYDTAIHHYLYRLELHGANLKYISTSDDLASHIKRYDTYITFDGGDVLNVTDTVVSLKNIVSNGRDLFWMSSIVGDDYTCKVHRFPRSQLR